MRKTYHS